MARVCKRHNRARDDDDHDDRLQSAIRLEQKTPMLPMMDLPNGYDDLMSLTVPECLELRLNNLFALVWLLRN